MTSLQDVSQYVLRDLAAFSDPGTAVGVNIAGGWAQATWEQRGRTITASFQCASGSLPGNIRVRDATGVVMSYAAFLAGDRMADLRSIARNTARSMRKIAGYVEPRAIFDGNPAPAVASPGLEEIAERHDSRTRLVFVTADAGVGKTSLLTEIVRRKATEYAIGRSPSLWLYVNAQGSRLARLDQALAAALDDVRAVFPYHAIAPLVRCGSLVLVIDGFDELIGAPGTYEDAYSSLATFLTSLGGTGMLVATARSAYYEQEFLARVGSIPGLEDEAWTLTRAELLDWDEAEQGEFISAFAAAHSMDEEGLESFRKQVTGEFETAGAGGLVSKPFFLSRVAQFLALGSGLEPGATFLDRLVNTYIARESQGKLLNSLGVPVLSNAQFRTVYEEIANEMWRQETRELSRSSFRELADLIAQLIGLDDSAREVVVDRLPNSAMLHSGEATRSVAFQHELLFSYFLAAPILSAFDSSSPLHVASALRKGKLPNEAGLLIGHALAGSGTSALAVLRAAPQAISLGSEQVRQNSGTIVAGILRAGLTPGAAVAEVDFVDVDLSHATCTGVSFTGCLFRGVDCRGTRFVRCLADGSYFYGTIVNSDTWLDIAGLSLTDVVGLETQGLAEQAANGLTAIYSPTETHRVLGVLGLPAAALPRTIRTVPSQVQELVSRFARIYEHTNIVYLENEFIMRRTLRNPDWPRVYDAFTEAGLIREEVRQTGGSSKVFVRLAVRPTDLMAGLDPKAVTDPRVQSFWALLASD